MLGARAKALDHERSSNETVYVRLRHSLGMENIRDAYESNFYGKELLPSIEKIFSVMRHSMVKCEIN